MLSQEGYLLISSVAMGLIGRLVFLYEIQEKKKKESVTIPSVFKSSLTGAFMGAVGYYSSSLFFPTKKDEVSIILSAILGFKGVDALEVVSEKLLGRKEEKKK